MKTRVTILISLAVLAGIDTVIPVPITAGLLIYVVLNKPEWFKDIVSELYSSRPGRRY